MTAAPGADITSIQLRIVLDAHIGRRRGWWVGYLLLSGAPPFKALGAASAQMAARQETTCPCTRMASTLLEPRDDKASVALGTGLVSAWDLPRLWWE